MCIRDRAGKSRYTFVIQHKHPIFVFWFLLLLSACDLMSNNQTVPESTATLTPTPVVTPALQSTPAIAVPITATETTPSLTIWIPPGTVLGSEAGAALFSDQLLTFNANHPDLETHVEQKTVAGQGGILSYLRTGSTIAPSILPDLIALPTNQLATAVTEGLIYPLNDLIEPALFDDLYPAAKTMAQVGEQLYLPVVAVCASQVDTPDGAAGVADIQAIDRAAAVAIHRRHFRGDAVP